MKGILVVNGFLKQEKYYEIYNMLKVSAENKGVSLEIIPSTKLVRLAIDNFSAISDVDFALFWDKDVYLAKLLERANIKVFNSAKAVEKCDNKILTYLSCLGKLKMPKTVIAPKTFDTVNYCNLEFLKDAVDILGFPMVVKEAFGSFGAQVYLVHDINELETLVKNFGAKEFIMQEFVKSSAGKDVRINVVGNKVVCAMLRSNKNDFRSNVTNGGIAQNFEPSKKFCDLAISACQILGLDFAGVDVMFGENNEPILCEVNSNPHFKSSLDCTGVDMSQKIIDYVLDKIYD